MTRPGAGFFISRTETVRDKYSTCKGELAQTEARLVRGCGSERHVLHGVAVFLRWRMLVTSADKSWTIHKSLAMRIGARRGRSLLLLEESIDCVATRVGERLEARQTRQGCNQRPGERLAGGLDSDSELKRRHVVGSTHTRRQRSLRRAAQRPGKWLAGPVSGAATYAILTTVRSSQTLKDA